MSQRENYQKTTSINLLKFGLIIFSLLLILTPLFSCLAGTPSVNLREAERQLTMNTSVINSAGGRRTAGADSALYQGDTVNLAEINRLKPLVELTAEREEEIDATTNNYETVRQTYLSTTDRRTGCSGTDRACNYVTNLQSATTVQQRIDELEARIDEIDNRLEDPALTPEEREALITEKEELEHELAVQQGGLGAIAENSEGIVRDEKRAKAQESAACFTLRGGFHFLNCVLQVTAAIGTLITGIFGSVLWLAGNVFDLSIHASISTLNGWLTDNTGITTAWRLMRDLANLCFIFILLYIALGTVFELKLGESTQKLIVNVVVIALLVNFSGFFTRVIIDASNIIAYEFYITMDGDQTGVARMNNIGWQLVQKLDLTRYYVDTNGDNLENPQINRLSFFGIIIQTFGNIFIILAAVFVLLTASILFLIRTVTLIFLYIFAPLAFVSKIIPNSKFNYYKPWLDKLVSQAFFAPAFLIPLYIVFKILDKGIGALAGANGNESLSMIGGGSTVTILMTSLVIGLLLGCIFIANKMGAVGAKLAMTGAGAGTLMGAKAATRIAKPFVGAIGGNRIAGTVGNTGRRLSGWAEANATSGNFWRRAGSDVISAGKTVGKSDFGKKVGGIVKNPLLAGNDWIGSAASTAGLGSVSILGKTGQERKDAKKAEKEAKEEAKKEEIKQKGLQLKAETTEAGATAILRTMTNEEIKGLKADALSNPHVSRSLNYSNLDALEKNGKLEDGQKATIKTNITTPPTPTPILDNSGYAYMTTGPGLTMW